MGTRAPMATSMIAGALVLAWAGVAGAEASADDAQRLRAAWSVKVSEPAGARVLLPVGGRLAAVTWQGELVMLDGASGKRIWRKKPRQTGGIDQVSIAADGRIVAAAWPGEAAVVGYQTNTGREMWSTPLPAIPTGMVGCEAHRAVVATHRGGGTLMATALDPKGGQLLWSVPAAGPVVGAGGGYVFTAVPSGFGVWPGTLQAISCVDGASRLLDRTGRQLVRFLAAGDGVAVAWHLDQGWSNMRVCLHPLKTESEPTCLTATDGQVAQYPAQGAMVRDGVVYVSTAHIEAHNLNPAPDSWVIGFDLTGKPIMRSPPLVSRQAPVDAGSVMWTGFGTTGIDDYAYFVDWQGVPVSRLPLRKAPTALAADAERAYVATYDGRIYAVKLPGPGRTPVVRQPVTPADSPAETPSAAAPDAGWTVVRTIDAHPKKARTSGSMRTGTADPAVFLDAAGTRVVVGGNDDKARVIDVQTGKRRWISKGLGKDVEAIQVGGDRFHVRVYGGTSFTFGPRGKGWKRLRRIKHEMGWMSGMTGDGARVITDDFAGNITAHDARSGKPAWTTQRKTGFDQRGVRVTGDRIVVHTGGALVVHDVSGAVLETVATRATPLRIDGGAMTQAWMIDEAHGVWEYCGPTRCVLEIGQLVGGDGSARRVVLDTRGAGWVPDVPSALAISADRRWAFFFRLGLDPLLIDLETDTRTPINTITGKAASEYTSGAFSADGRRLVLGMHPRPWQVTVIELGK